MDDDERRTEGTAYDAGDYRGAYVYG